MHDAIYRQRGRGRRSWTRGRTMEKSIDIFHAASSIAIDVWPARNASVYWGPCDYVARRSADHRSDGFLETDCATTSHLAQANYKTLREKGRERQRRKERKALSARSIMSVLLTFTRSKWLKQVPFLETHCA